MNKASAYDLVIFTARKEEQFFLREFFQPTADPFYPMVDQVQPKQDWGNLRIGLVNIEEMGNVASAMKGFQIVEHLLPRAVAMVGLAASYKPDKGDPKLRLGDVGIGRQIFYHSYGKAKGAGHREIRDKLDVPQTRGFDWVAKQIGRADFLTAIRELVLDWWEEGGKFDKKSWLKQITNPKDLKDYEIQDQPDRDIRVDAVAVSSGEEVIADARLIEHIRAVHHVKDISLFEMESYGLGRVCKEFEIPFLLIKGVSDYADAPPGFMRRLFEQRLGGKNDKSRWRSIAGSSAVLIQLLRNGFGANVVKDSHPKRPGVGKHADCLHPDGGVPCRYKDAVNIASDLRGCMNPGLNLKRPPTWLCRTFDDVSARDFSSELHDSVKRLVENQRARITTFFPYSAQDLIHFFRRKHPRSALLDIIAEKGTNLDNKRIEAMREFVNSMQKELTHFKTFDDVCKRETLQPLPKVGRQPNIARVIVLDDSEHSLVKQAIINDSYNAVFPLLLGKSVPTYFVSAQSLLDEQACAADVTFIDHRTRPIDLALGIGALDVEQYGDLVAVRFFDTSNTMIVTALKPCHQVEDHREIQPPSGLHKLYDIWQKGCEGNPAYSSLFEPFPMTEIIERWALDIQ